MNWRHKGTLEELRQVTTELAELHAERAELTMQEAILQEHRRIILHLLAEKARK